MPDTKDFTPEQAAEYIGLSLAGLRYHLYRAFDIFPLPKRSYHDLRFSKEELDRFKRNRRKQGRPKNNTKIEKGD